MTMDDESSKNLILKETVKKLKLPTQPYPNCYKLAWFCKGKAIPITSRCLAKFNTGNQFCDEVLCDVLENNVCHVLFGSPWLYECNIVHCTKSNNYSFRKDEKNINLHPHKKNEHISQGRQIQKNIFHTPSSRSEKVTTGIVKVEEKSKVQKVDTRTIYDDQLDEPIKDLLSLHAYEKSLLGWRAASKPHSLRSQWSLI